MITFASAKFHFFHFDAATSPPYSVRFHILIYKALSRSSDFKHATSLGVSFDPITFSFPQHLYVLRVLFYPIAFSFFKKTSVTLSEGGIRKLLLVYVSRFLILGTLNVYLVYLKVVLTSEAPQAGELKKMMKLGIFITQFFCCTKLTLRGEIHLWNSGYFPILCDNSRTVRYKKKGFRQKLLLLIRTIIGNLQSLQFANYNTKSEIAEYSGNNFTSSEWIWAAKKKIA